MQKAVKANALRRLKSARGHLDHVISMIDAEKYCIDILQQSLAVQSALRAVDNIVLKGHLEEHVAHAMHGKNKQRSIQEVVDVFEKARK
ncbi:metal-sensitive transcriptional regulator [Candidatus Curtissbacteria bacterium]|nr:metal-sensitive transcriptional regulator [Candidatus Curtissbacteria bacterium]MBI2594410.1 metal-sensitive transcriptional regulator [Candidatus Curtissbacteria bacterium]